MIVPLELLKVLADEVPIEATTRSSASNADEVTSGESTFRSRLDVAKWLTSRSREFRIKETQNSKVFQIDCPFNPDHKVPDAAIFQRANGALGAKCLHDSCSSKGWQEFKEAIGKPDPDHWDPPLQVRAGGKRKQIDRRKKGSGRANAAESNPEPASEDHGDAWEGDDPQPVDLEPTSDCSLQRIDAGNGDLAAVTAQAWEAILTRNSPKTLFRYGAVPARIETDDDGAPVVRVMTLDRMRHRLARDAYWYVEDDEGAEKPAYPPTPVVRDVLATPDAPLPILTRVVESPIFAKDGTLQMTPGYCPASRTFYAPGPDFIVPKVPSNPSSEDLDRARALLIDELLGDFPFVCQADKAHAVSAMLSPFAREFIEGPTPILNFEAPGPGTGKTLLVEVLTIPSLGRPATAMTEGRDEDEWRKRILAKLMSAPTIVLIDNVRRRVDSSALASAVTAFPLWEDRVLGKSEIIRVPVRCTWLMTGNNPAFTSEMTRRTVRCRLDSKVDQPWLRTGFRHPSLREWCTDHRDQLVWAALTIIQAWVAAGRPSGTATLGMFESWARVMGGILAVAQIDGFLANSQEFYAEADAESSMWRLFIAAWWDAHGQRPVKSAELYTLAVEVGMHLGDKSEQSQKVILGTRITDARDRAFRVEDGHTYRIERAGTAKRAAQWKLVRVGESGESG